MIPKFLQPEVFPYSSVEQMLAAVLVPVLAASVCADCGVVLPADVPVLCQPCLDRRVA